MSVRVLVTSDTHQAIGAKLPAGLLRLADRADHVVHAGDLIHIDVYDTLAALAPITAVVGNVDDAQVAAHLPERAQVTIGDVAFAVVHDAGPANGRHARLRGWFPVAKVLVYGHTHLPERSTLADGTIVVNPGSPTQRRRAPTHTACWIDVDEGAVAAAEIVHLD